MTTFNLFSYSLSASIFIDYPISFRHYFDFTWNVIVPRDLSQYVCLPFPDWDWRMMKRLGIRKGSCSASSVFSVLFQKSKSGQEVRKSRRIPPWLWRAASTLSGAAGASSWLLLLWALRWIFLRHSLLCFPNPQGSLPSNPLELCYSQSSLLIIPLFPQFCDSQAFSRLCLVCVCSSALLVGSQDLPALQGFRRHMPNSSCGIPKISSWFGVSRLNPSSLFFFYWWGRVRGGIYSTDFSKKSSKILLLSRSPAPPFLYLMHVRSLMVVN